jgi:hypothetical protein
VLAERETGEGKKITDLLIRTMVETAKRISQQPECWWFDQLNTQDGASGYHSMGAIRWRGQEISKLPSYERARMGIGIVPQGREIFRCSPCARISRPLPQHSAKANAFSRTKSLSCFRSCATCSGGAAAICPAVSNSSSPSDAPW